jgi:hypothetical protein
MFLKESKKNPFDPNNWPDNYHVFENPVEKNVAPAPAPTAGAAPDGSIPASVPHAGSPTMKYFSISLIFF